MHALTCDILTSGDIAYAMIPTYNDPSRFIAAKVYVEFAWHSDTCIFYHCIVTELLDETTYLLQTMHSCTVRSIERATGRLALRHPDIKQFSLSNVDILRDMQAWQKNYVLDLPAPFVVKTANAFENLKQDIQRYFGTLLHNIAKQNEQISSI